MIGEAGCRVLIVSNHFLHLRKKKVVAVATEVGQVITESLDRRRLIISPTPRKYAMFFLNGLNV